MFKKITLVILLAMLGINFSSMADENKHFKVTLQPSKQTVEAGEEFTIRASFEFEKGWYTYSIKSQVSSEGIGPTPTEMVVKSEDFLEATGKANHKAPTVKYDEGYEMDIEYFKGHFYLDLPVKAKKKIDFTKDKISIEVYLQQCTDVSCLQPMSFMETVSAEIFDPAAGGTDEQGKPEEAATEAAAEKQNDKAEAASTEKTVEKAEVKDQESDLEKSLWAIIWQSMLAGAGALLMPCVFPLIPITVSFFTNRMDQAKGKSKGLRDATAYALGIILTFTGIGVLFALIFGTAAKEIMTSPGVYIFIAGIFLLFGFSLFGAYEIMLPTSLINKLNAKSQQGDGIGSVLLMGLTFSLASFSCTGPIVLTALFSIASGDFLYPIISMLAFSTVLAAPFFFLALFPSLMAKMPKSGGWMNNLKVVFGFIILAATMYYINNAFIKWDIEFFTRESFLAVITGIMLMTSLYIIGLFKFKLDSPVSTVGTPRMLFAVIFFSITFYLMTGLFGYNLGELETFLPQERSEYMNSTGVVEQKLDWLHDYKEGVEIAKKENKKIFLDFTGETCTNCKKMEKKVFTKPEIKERLEKFVRIKLYVDEKEILEFQKEKFNDVGQPFYGILNPDESIIATQQGAEWDVEKFAAFLDKGLK